MQDLGSQARAQCFQGGVVVARDGGSVGEVLARCWPSEPLIHRQGQAFLLRLGICCTVCDLLYGGASTQPSIRHTNSHFATQARGV